MPLPPNAYIKVDSSLGSNEKFLDVEDELYLEAVGLYVLILGYCDRASTDGRVSRRAVTGVRGLAPGRDDLVEEMRRVGLLTGDGRLTVKDYLEWQRSRADKQAASERGREAADARWSAKRNAGRNAKRNAQTDRQTLSVSKGDKQCVLCEGDGFVMTDDDKAAPCPKCGAGEEAVRDE